MILYKRNNIKKKFSCSVTLITYQKKKKYLDRQTIRLF